MIKLRLSFGDKHEDSTRDYQIQEGEILLAAVTTVLKEVPLNGFRADEVFQVIHNGHKIDPELWGQVRLRNSDNVLVTPLIKNGEAGQVFKQVVFAAVIAVAYAYGAGVITIVAISIATNLVLNALIPPPVFSGLNPQAGEGLETSQMYSIAGQSNNVKRFGLVPKVYGTHRVFPNVAAYPYTSLEADAVTGELFQYLYAIYDFGFGPLKISEISIGDTPLSDTNFNDFTYNLVDPNRPLVSEGEWDDPLKTNFTLYKGDFDGEALSIGLNGNAEQGAPESEYQAIRNTAVNTSGAAQEIIVNFVNPLGLYGFSAAGARSWRQIDMDISFSLVGEDIWKKYNDLTYVDAFTSAGGDSDLFELDMPLVPPAYADVTYYSNIDYSNGRGGGTTAKIIKPGTRKFLVRQNTTYVIGSPVYLNARDYIGNIVSVVNVGPTEDPNSYMEVTLDRDINNYTELARFPLGGGTGTYFGIIFRTTTSTTGRARIHRDDTAPVYSSFKFTPKIAGQYKVRVQRLSTSGPYSTQVGEDLTWSSLVTRFDRVPIVTDKRHLFLEIRIKATSQLNGTISNLSAVCQSVCDVYDDGTQTWSKQPTSNPAWVFTDMLIGEVNKKAVAKSRLHLPSIVEWADFCDAIPTPPPSQTYDRVRFETNFVLDFPTTLQQALGQVAGSAQASLNLIDGKYGVLIDRYRDTPVQIFTPRNSKDFSSVRVYTTRPHGLRVKYIDPNLNWETSEIIAYDEGYTLANATDIEDITSFACTNNEQAWRFGRYMIAQNKLRQETISILVDFENLVCTRGDYVQITQDVMRVGGTPARVKSVSGNVITTDDAIDQVPMVNYGYVFRGVSGISGDTLTINNPREFELDGDLPAVGDLIVIGEVTRIVYDCLVKSISPNDDLSANITLVEKADAIYDYESSGVLPDYDPQISQTTDPNLQPPGEVQNLTVTDNLYECADSGYNYYVDLIWDVPVGSVYELFSVLVDSGRGYSEVATTRNTSYHYIVDQTRLGFEHSFKILAVSAGGRKLPIGSVTAVTATPEEKTTPPSDVERLSTDITNEVLQLAWPQVDDCDCKEYLIRFSPLMSGVLWESSIPLLKVDRNVTTASTQARTGTYLIKAIDFVGNESINASLAITTIPNLFNLNIVEEISDSPDYLGNFDRTVDAGGSLILDFQEVGGIDTAEYYTEGYYYYQNLLDLGDIFTVRLQSLIQAEGYTVADLMSSWVTLDTVLAMSTSSYSEWAVETQYRSSTSLNAIADWTSLDVIAQLNEGNTEDFTEWRVFNMGDATGRIFQFRLRLLSYKPSVSPRIFEALIRADMPDRIDSYNNLLVSAVNGYTIDYEPAFYGPSTTPNVQVSIEDASSGDYWAFDYKTLDGLKIRLYDNTDTQVSRTIDVAVKGHGRKYTSNL